MLRTSPKAREENNNRRYSPIAEKGYEMDVMRCYLQGMTIYKTLAWLKENKNFTTSKSSLGRYWKKFSTLGLKPGMLKYI